MSFCTSCGRQRSTETERFCPACGAPHDPAPADPEPFAAVAQPAPPSSAPGSMPAPPPPPPPGPTGPAGPAAAPSAPSGTRRPAGVLLAVVGTVVALIAAAVIAWQLLWPRGGADSPEAAVEQLVEAAVAQDPVAALDLLAPGEAEGLGDVLERTRERAEDEGLADDEGLTDALELELTGLDLDVDELGDDMARVSVRDGDYRVSWDPDRLPERLRFLAEEAPDASEAGSLADLLEGERIYVTTVKQDGRWYVTALGTYLENLVESADLGSPDYDVLEEDLEPVVGEDPEAVVDNLVDAVNAGDLEELLANLPEDLVRPLRPYAELAQDILDDEAVSFSVSADRLETDTEDIGDGRIRVAVEQAELAGAVTEGDGDGGSGGLSLAHACVTASESDGDQGSFCLRDELDGEGLSLDDLGLEEFFVVLREVDDGYQLDPMATVAEYAGVVLDSLDDDLVDDLLQRWEDEVQPEEDW